MTGETKEVNHPTITKAIEETVENLFNDFKMPAKEVVTQPIIERNIVNNREKLRFVTKEPSEVIQDTITREPILKEKYRTETLIRPGKSVVK